MNTLEKVKNELSEISFEYDVQKDLNSLINYFDNSPDFQFIEGKDGIPYYGYVDVNEDDKNKFRKYKEINDEFIVNITVFDFRKICILVTSDGLKFNGYALERIEQNNETSAEYRIVAKKDL